MTVEASDAPNATGIDSIAIVPTSVGRPTAGSRRPSTNRAVAATTTDSPMAWTESISSAAHERSARKPAKALNPTTTAKPIPSRTRSFSGPRTAPSSQTSIVHSRGRPTRRPPAIARRWSRAVSATVRPEPPSSRCIVDRGTAPP
jgi:hypothetical protein